MGPNGHQAEGSEEPLKVLLGSSRVTGGGFDKS